MKHRHVWDNMGKITLKEASAEFKISDKTLRRWINIGKLPFEQASGPTGLTYYVEQSHIKQLVNKRGPLHEATKENPIARNTSEIEELKAIVNQQSKQLEELLHTTHALRGEIHSFQNALLERNKQESTKKPWYKLFDRSH